jgi:hypothetical protein
VEVHRIAVCRSGSIPRGAPGAAPGWIDDDVVSWNEIDGKQMFRGLTDAEVWCQNARSPPQHVCLVENSNRHLNEMFGLNKKTFGLALIPQSCLRLASEIYGQYSLCHLGGGAKNDATTTCTYTQVPYHTLRLHPTLTPPAPGSRTTAQHHHQIIISAIKKILMSPANANQTHQERRTETPSFVS